MSIFRKSIPALTFSPVMRLNVTMRRPLIAANWKMNKTISEARDFVQSLLPSVKDIGDTEIVIAPPFTSLFAVEELLKGTNIMLAAQDVFYEEKGAFTGEVSPIMLRDAGCEYVIIGHSERRQYFSEDDSVVNRKAKVSQKTGGKEKGIIDDNSLASLLNKYKDALERKDKKAALGLLNEMSETLKAMMSKTK